MILVLDSSESKWLLCLAILQTCSCCLPLTPACEWLLCLAGFQAHSWCLPLALQSVSCWTCCVSGLLLMMPASWLFREWVAAVPCYISSLLMISVLGFSVCEWLQYLAVFFFKPTHKTCSWLPREWVAAVPHWFQAYWWCLSLALQSVSCCGTLWLFKPGNNTYLGSLECEWLLALLCLMFTDDACSWLFRKCVTVLSCHG